MYIDLHCHLEGSIPLATLRRLAKRNGVLVPEADAELRALIEAPEDCPSLDDYLMRFDLPSQCLQAPIDWQEAAHDAALAAYADGVAYIEYRFATPLDAPSIRAELEAVWAGLTRAKAECGVLSGMIVCGMRDRPVEQNVAVLRAARECEGVCGTDIAGGEVGHPTYKQAALFREAYRLGLPYTIHAGECGSVTNVLDAVAFGARRIGHGIALRQSAEARRFCRERGVAIELCPVSNQQTKAVPSLDEYPLRQFLRDGLRVTINTDNRTVSGTSFAREYELLRSHFAVTPDEQRLMTRNAIEAAFAADEVKDALLRKLAAE